MRNVFIIPTDKPSRLAYDFYEKFYLLSEDTQFFEFQNLVQNRELYITNDEEIKVNDYITDGYKVWQWKDDSSLLGRKKVILSTDQDLINDGVQAIDDDFLEWFISKANDSGKPIDIFEVTYGVLKPFQSEDKGYLIHFSDNEVLEEPKQDYTALLKQVGTKQETLEEVAFNYAKSLPKAIGDLENIVEMYKRYSFVEGAKWQAERMYSEEDIKQLFKCIILEIEIRKQNIISNSEKMTTHLLEGGCIAFESSQDVIKEQFEQFKKK